jgi:exonuclease III
LNGKHLGRPATATTHAAQIRELHGAGLGKSAIARRLEIGRTSVRRVLSGFGRAEPFLLVGDWNTGAHRLDETGKTFVCAEHFGRLSTLGWTDMWRHHNPGITECIWYSKLKSGVRGNGFRLDHAFATPSLVQRITSCRYSHVEREAGISDHSIVIVELAQSRQ